MKIKCILVDDEPLAIKVLEKYAGELAQLEVVGVFTNPIEATTYLQSNSVDLLFLDINMPKISGISLLQTLPHPPLVIFTTAYPEYAVEGFELEALDYLLKPFPFERFLKAVNKASNQLEIQKKLEHSTTLDQSAHLIIKADRKLYPLPYANILYLQAYGDYVKIHTKEKTYLPKETLQNFEQELPGDRFVRVHRSYIIAMDAIQYIEGNHLMVCDQMIPIGSAHRDQLLSKLNLKK